MIYTGIGARKTPQIIQVMMAEVAEYLAKKHITLRSGGAMGADTAFERGCNQGEGPREIYLPWKGFNHSSSRLHNVSEEAIDIARIFHPNWATLSRPAKLFMGRNSYQILGQDLKTKSDFVVCWTPAGKITGGTGQALRMAKHYDIPILNFGDTSPDDIEIQLLEILEKYYD